MSQQPYQPSQQPGGYQQPTQGYPQGGYQQPAQPPGYGNYPRSPQYGGAGGGNPLSTSSGLAPILQILAYVVAGLSVIGGIFSFTIDGLPGSYKFFNFCLIIVIGLGLAGVLLAMSVGLKSRSAASD